jgi:hypothetical protein
LGLDALAARAHIRDRNRDAEQEDLYAVHRGLGLAFGLERAPFGLPAVGSAESHPVHPLAQRVLVRRDGGNTPTPTVGKM